MFSREQRVYVNRLRPEWFRHHESSSSRPLTVGQWDPVTTVGPDLIEEPIVETLRSARWALRLREFDVAETLLQEALDLAPGSPEGHTLMGLLREAQGQQHAAYQSYKAALTSDRGHGPALCLMRAYCERFGLNFNNPCINPAART